MFIKSICCLLILSPILMSCSTVQVSMDAANQNQVQSEDGNIQEILSVHYQDEIRQAAKNLIQSLTDDQRSQLILSYHHPYRTRGFCYVLAHCKTDYVGLRIGDMSARQKINLNGFLMKSLNRAGYAQAIGTFNREWLIEEMEHAHHNDPAKFRVIGSEKVPDWRPPQNRGGPDFYIAFFGSPVAQAGPWAARFEGHHLSINLTFGSHGEVGVAPLFFGSSPMTVPKAPSEERHSGKYKLWAIQEGQQSLRREAWLARNFLKTLTEQQRQQGKWPYLPHAELEGGTDKAPQQSKGFLQAKELKNHSIPVRSLSLLQKNLLVDFLFSFSNISQSKVFTRQNWIKQLDNAQIWWHGDWSNEEAQLYFRIQTQRYLVELLQSNTFGVVSDVNANHIHAAFRDLENDWDFDIIKEHVNHHHR